MLYMNGYVTAKRLSQTACRPRAYDNCTAFVQLALYSHDDHETQARLVNYAGQLFLAYLLVCSTFVPQAHGAFIMVMCPKHRNVKITLIKYIVALAYYDVNACRPDDDSIRLVDTNTQIPIGWLAQQQQKCCVLIVALYAINIMRCC